MVGLAGHSEGGWFSFSCFHASCVLGGVAGWNIVISLWFFCGFRVAGFGTLLGPEGTPGDRLCFLAAPGPDRLTHPLLWVWWWLYRCWGVVVC